MKKYYYSLLFSLLYICIHAQTITIPNVNFKNTLLESNTTNTIAKDALGNNIKIDANSDNQIQMSEALSVYQLKVNSNSIASFSGIENFTNLEKLDCSFNSMTSLNVTNLIHLKDLNCSHSALTALNITTLPDLQNLNCEFNVITALAPAGITGLKKISCQNNRIQTLNLTGLINLVNLDCSYNSLQSLIFSDLNSIVTFYCNRNSIPSLNFSNLATLRFLNCGEIYNLSSLNLTGLVNLESLSVEKTQLPVLDLTNLPKLYSVSCYENSFLSLLDVSGLRKLQYVNCRNTNIRELDLGAARSLNTLNISYTNSLKTLNIKNSSAMSNDNFTHVLTALKEICLDQFEIGVVSSVFDATFHPLISSYCNITPGGGFNTVTGVLKLDYNNNGCDANDVLIDNAKLVSNVTNGFNTAYTSNQGLYAFYTSGNSITVTPTFRNNYFTATPASRTINFPASTFYNNSVADFCITSNGVHNDLEISGFSLASPRPGFRTSLYIVYKNNGNTTQSGNVTLNFEDDFLNLVQSVPVIDAQGINSLSWNFTDLKPFESRIIKIFFDVNPPTATPPVNLGQILNYTATVATNQVDENPVDNIYTMRALVIGSFDPNDKTVVEGPQISINKVNDYLHYLVRFQNTGTARASNVIIKDIIDPTLDLSTMETISTSHPCKTIISDGNKTEFFFEDIELLPSSIDEPASHGYVAFKIKPNNTVGLGSVMQNTANIYFDYNLPIITNTTATTVVALGRNDFKFGDYFLMYPNPVNNMLNIEVKELITVQSIQIYNSLGQLVQTVAVTDSLANLNLDVSDLKPGYYFIRVISDKGKSTEKFIKN